MSGPRCENCRYWARDHFGRALGGYNCDGSVSDCRRRAPIGQNDERRLSGGAIWPTTKISDWCGEFASARVTAAATSTSAPAFASATASATATTALTSSGTLDIRAIGGES